MAEFQKLSEVNILEKLSTETNILVEDSGDVKKIRSSLFRHETSSNGSGRVNGMIFKYPAPTDSSGSSGSSDSRDYKFVLAKSLPVFDSEDQLLSFLNGNCKAYDFYGDEMTLVTAKQVFDYTLNMGFFIVNGNSFIDNKDNLIANLKNMYPDIDDYNISANMCYVNIEKSFIYAGYCDVDNNTLTVKYKIYGRRFIKGSSTYDTQITFSGDLSEWF